MKRITASICAALLASLTAHALEEDRLQEIVIQGQSAELDEQSGIITYRGSVTLIQGSLELSAEVLLAKREDGQVIEIAASQGDSDKPVSYSQLIRQGEPQVTAFAQEMVYDLRGQTIELTGDAELKQSDIEFRGDSILYDITRGKTEADGGVEMTLPGRLLDTLDQQEDEVSDLEGP